jgi:NAD(P)-dependent dehydrogenase (short-subunit alcohol dehydrogenase family)
MNDDQRHSPRHALITGGSQGLGRSLAYSLGRRGASVALVARHPAPLRETVDALRASGIDAHGIQGDVGDPRAVSAIAGQAHALLSSIDLLVHAASTLGPIPMPHLADLDTDAFERVLQVNVLGPHRLTRAVLGGMLLADRGTVVSISSDAAVEAHASWGAYSAGKAALDHLSRVWAAEVEGTGVRFLSVDPGEMDTAMHAAAMPDADRSVLAHPDDIAERIADIIEQDERAPSGERVSAPEWELRA